MNLFYKTYSHPKESPTTQLEWKEYGVNQFCKLYSYMGFTYNKRIINSIKKHTHVIEIDSGIDVISPDALTNSIYFILKGGVKMSYVQDDKEIVLNLLTEGNVIGAFYSLINNTLPPFSATTTEKTVFLVAEKKDFDLIKAAFQTQDFNQFIFQIIHECINNQKAMMQFHYYNTLEKIRLIYNEYPEMLQRFYIKHVANLTGVHPDAFSRKRKFV